MNEVLKEGCFISFTYTNWRGETGERKAIVKEFVYGSNEYHKEPQFMIIGIDFDKHGERSFAAKDMSNVKVISYKVK
jgi:hypothetical protein